MEQEQKPFKIMEHREIITENEQLKNERNNVLLILRRVMAVVNETNNPFDAAEEWLACQMWSILKTRLNRLAVLESAVAWHGFDELPPSIGDNNVRIQLKRDDGCVYGADWWKNTSMVSGIDPILRRGEFIKYGFTGWRYPVGDLTEWNELANSHSQRVTYFNVANAEIRRLQQQLADAPSWGEWVDATVENLENPELDGGFYEFEWDNEATSLLIFTYDCTWLNEDGNAEEIFDDDDDIMPVRFRRLKYTPKPAREVEKKYGGDTLSK